MGGCVRAAAAGLRKLELHAIKLNQLPKALIARRFAVLELWRDAGPSGALRARVLPGAARSTDLLTVRGTGTRSL